MVKRINLTFVVNKQIFKYWNNILLIIILLLFYCCSPNYDELINSVKSGNILEVQRILNGGINLTNINNDQNPLNLSIAANRRDITKLLIENNININMKIKNGDFVIFYFDDDIEILKLLIQKKADLSVIDVEGYTLFHRVVMKDNLDIVKLLFENGIDINKKTSDNRGYTPLMLAVESGEINNIKYLISVGANINETDNLNGIPLLFNLPWTQERDLKNIADYLIEKGVDINNRLRDGLTPLHGAVMAGKLNYIKYLLEHGANPNVKDDYGNLPIFYTSYLTKAYLEGSTVSEENRKIKYEIEQVLIEYMNR